MSHDSKRREFLKRGVVVGTLAGLAGCGGQPGDGGPEDSPGGGGGTPTATLDKSTPEPEVEYELLPRWTFQVLPRSNDPQMYEWAVMARQQLERLGLRFEWEVLESSTWVSELFARNWDFNRLTWFGTVERVFPFYNLHYSFNSKFANEDGGNFEMWTSEEYDTVVENFNSALDPQEQQEYAHQAQEILAVNQPVLFGFAPNTLVAANTNQYQNWKEMFGTMVYFNINSLRDIQPVGGGSTAIVYGTTEAQENYPNFFAVTGHSLETHKMNYDTPVAFDYNGETYGLAAEDWEIVDDTTVDVTLREGMSWHDGEEVTGEDLKWTWDAITEHGIPYLASDVDPYESSELLDDYTVRFNLSYAFGGFIKISLFRVPILPKHIWDGITEEEGLEHPSEWSDPDMTGSGPFMQVTYEPGNRIVWEKNPDHRFADQIEYDTLVYNVYGAEAPLTGDLIGGDVSFTQSMGPTHWDRANNADGVTASSSESLAVTGIWCRCDKDPFTDVRVRQGLAHAINEQEVIDIVFRGEATNARSPIAKANDFYYNPDTPDMPYNVGKARDLLVEAGLRWDDRGRLVKPVDWEPEVTYMSPDEYSA